MCFRAKEFVPVSVSELISISLGGSSQQVPAGATGTELFSEFPHVIAVRVHGELKDLAYVVQPGDDVEAVEIDSPDGLNILRHSTTHVLAQAVQQLRPDAKLGIGPHITDGFYYDFDVAEPFTPEDLKALKKLMQKIVNQGQLFRRRVVSESEALEFARNEPYKRELIQIKGHPGDEDGASVEVGGAELTYYENVDPRTGEVAWRDLCRGPHLPNTKLIGNGFDLMRVSAAYWRGDQKNAQLQRIYGTAWPTREELVAYKTRLEEAARRDHRKLGAELDLFSFPEEIGPGLVVFHPKGGIIKREMEDYVRRRHVEEGFWYVGTPHITKRGLFETSGHLPYYEDTMFPAMRVDEERDAEGNIVKEGQEYFLKAMSCPMHNLIYRSQPRSYRDLPLRLFEFGTVYRYEKSGVVQGLTRVRGLTQDDSHTYCTPEQAPGEIRMLLTFILGLLRDFGLHDFYLELSTRGEGGKFIGSDEDWENATSVLRTVAEESGLELVPDPGGAAFYGPKISVQARDAIGRSWQMSTIQYDFNQPERFGLEYMDSDSERKRPVMIHSAKFGSIERFFGVLTEHYAGAFPVWLSPVQVEGIPVAEEYNDYLLSVADQMRRAGIRAEVDTGTDRMPKKIRTHSKQKVPFIMIAGEDDRSQHAVSFRYRDGHQRNGIPVDEAIALVREAIDTKAQV